MRTDKIISTIKGNPSFQNFENEEILKIVGNLRNLLLRSRIDRLPISYDGWEQVIEDMPIYSYKKDDRYIYLKSMYTLPKIFVFKNRIYITRIKLNETDAADFEYKSPSTFNFTESRYHENDGWFTVINDRLYIKLSLEKVHMAQFLTVNIEAILEYPEELKQVDGREFDIRTDNYPIPTGNLSDLYELLKNNKVNEVSD